jgi:hypothetical protein
MGRNVRSTFSTMSRAGEKLSPVFDNPLLGVAPGDVAQFAAELEEGNGRDVGDAAN